MGPAARLSDGGAQLRQRALDLGQAHGPRAKSQERLTQGTKSHCRIKIYPTAPYRHNLRLWDRGRPSGGVGMGLSAKRSDDESAARLAAGVASYALGIRQDDILSEARGAVATAFARQVAMYLCHAGFELSLTRVAIAFGRDRSTVSHACHLIEDRREEPLFDLWIGSLEAMLPERSPPHHSHLPAARR